MTDDHAQALIDLAVVGFGVVAVVYVLRTPSLRRATWRVLKTSLFHTAPAFLWRETTRAWAEAQRT